MPLLAIAHPAITLDLRYATADNFTGQVIYDKAVALLHPDAHAALMRAADLAQAQGLGLRVFDAYRPLAAQWRLWQAVPDPNYVADPRVGSMHARGVAVDLTLTDAQGQALDMGTPFDTLNPLSWHGCTDVPPEAQANRARLAGLMAISAWVHHPREWWHYNLMDPKRYPPIEDATMTALLMGGL
jgi:D-alanyl-D-alanine dipeptidase